MDAFLPLDVCKEANATTEVTNLFDTQNVIMIYVHLLQMKMEMIFYSMLLYLITLWKI
jgi:hypothetical protein